MYTTHFTRSVFGLLVVIYSIMAASPTSKKKIEMKPCYKRKPNFIQCFKEELVKVIPELGSGYPKLKIPAIEPFDLTALEITKGSGAVAIDLSLHNIKIHGLSSAKIDELQLDPYNLTAFARLSFALPVSLVGSYKANGKVQVLPINGKGPCNITLINPILELYDLKGGRVVRNGIEYVTIKDAKLRVTKMKKLILNFENLFQGNKEISDNLNIFINENWQLLLEELKPAFEEAIMAIVKDIVSKVFDKLSLKEIFPE